MTILSKLSLVLVTYNRPGYALRNMRYWSGRAVTLIVLDGSDEPIDSALIAELGNNVRYYHFAISVHERLAKSIDLIDTEYAALYGDDEYFSPTGLENCIAELEADASLVSCMGRTIGFNPTSEGLIGRPWYSEMRGYSLLQEDPVERMAVHMGDYTCSTIYSVVRTPIWKHAMGIFSKHIFTVFSMEEYLFEMAVAFMGKSKVIPVLYWFRSLENERIIQNENKFNIWWNRSSSNEEKELFINLMVESLSEISNINKKNLRKGIIRTGNAFTQWANSLGLGAANNLNPGYWKRLTTFILRVSKGVQRRLFKKPMVKVAVENKKKMYPFSEALEQLENEGVKINEKEVAEIEFSVMNFYSKKTETINITE